MFSGRRSHELCICLAVVDLRRTVSIYVNRVYGPGVFSSQLHVITISLVPVVAGFIVSVVKADVF